MSGQLFGMCHGVDVNRNVKLEYADEVLSRIEAVEMISTPDMALANAYSLMVSGLHIFEAIVAGRITQNHVVRELNIYTGDAGQENEGGRITIHHAYEPGKFEVAGHNLRLAAFGTSAIAADTALDEAFGSKDPSDTSERGAARAIFYMIRCAFAHGPFTPKWEVAPKYQRVYEVSVPTQGAGQSIIARFDGAARNRQPLSPSHFGGWQAYLALLLHARVLVRRHATVSPSP